MREKDLRSRRERLMNGATKWVAPAFDLPTPELPTRPPREDRMAYTHFEICTVKVAGMPKRAARATCGHCKNSEELPINTHRSHGGDDDVVEKLVDKKFESIGWLIEKSASQHRCPSCFTAIKASRRRKSEMKNEQIKNKPTTEVSNKIVQMPQLIVPPKPEIGSEIVTKNTEVTQEHGARRPTRDDKRIIYEKLRDVYVNETVGYMAGWSDKRVGDDLSVPRQWVSNIRDDNFGPDIDEATFNLIHEARSVWNELMAARLNAEPIMRQLIELTTRATEIES